MDSYALPDRQPVGPGNSPDTVSIRGGVQGGVNTGINTSFSPTNPAAANSTLDSLARFTQRALAPAIQREREARFLRGASRVAQGEAAADIDEQRPAWARAFGDTDEVLGARAYEGKADAARAELALRDTMEQDAELPPDEYAKVLQKRLASLETGDADRDTVWKSQVMGSLPLMMKEQAKANKSWSQKKALAARDDAIGAHITAFETAAKNAGSTWSVEDRRTYVSKLLSDIAPIAPGENPEVRDAQLARHLEAQVAAGRFATIGIFKETPELWQSIPTPVQDRLEQMVRTRASQEIGKSIGDHPDLWESVYGLSSKRFGSVAELLGEAQKLNDELRIRTGIPADLITQQDLMRMWGQQHAQTAAEAKATAAALSKALGAKGRGTAPEVVQDNRAMAVFDIPGAAARAKDLGVHTNRELNIAADTKFGQVYPDPKATAQFILNAGPHKIPAMEQRAAALEQATQWSSEFDAQLRIVQQLGLDRAKSSGYWSPFTMRVIEEYEGIINQRDSRGNPATTPQLAFAEARSRILAEPIRAAATKARPDKVKKAIAKTVDDWADKFFGPNLATDQSKKLLGSLVGMEVDRSPVGMDDSSAIANAWARVQSTAKSIGPHFYLDKSGSSKEPWEFLSGAGHNGAAIAPAFEAVIQEKLGKGAKINEADVIMRFPGGSDDDPAQDLVFFTTAVGKDGDIVRVIIRKQDLQRHITSQALARIPRQREGNTVSPEFDTGPSQ